VLLSLEHPVMCGEALPNRQELSRIQPALFLASTPLALALEFLGGQGVSRLGLDPLPCRVGVRRCIWRECDD
jgi:hypothetical protein